MTRPHSTTSPSIISKNHHPSHPLLYPPELLPRPTPELTHTPSAINSTSTFTYLTISLSSAVGVSKKLIIIHIHIPPHSSSSLHKQRRIPIRHPSVNCCTPVRPWVLPPAALASLAPALSSGRAHALIK